MSTTAFTTVTAFEMILFGEHDEALFRFIGVAWLYFNFLFKICHKLANREKESDSVNNWKVCTIGTRSWLRIFPLNEITRS